MYTYSIPSQVNLIDTAVTNLPKAAKAILKATLILIMGCALAALILTVAIVKISQIIIKDIQAMNRAKKAKKSLPLIAGFQPKALLMPTPKVKITPEQIRQVRAIQDPLKTQPLVTTPQPSQIDPEPAQAGQKVYLSLDDLKALAKAHKVKSWASYKKPENLQAKLESMGILPNPA